MKPILKGLFVLFPLLLLTTCLDNIAIEVPENTPLLTVDGAIYNASGPYFVNLSESAQFVVGPDGIPDPVTGASITLKDDLGNEEVLTEIETGKYATAADGMQGTVGRSYWIDIQIGEKNYQSQPEEMLPVVSAESLEFELSTEQQINPAGNFVDVNLITILLNTRLPNTSEQTFLKWNSFGIYKFPESGSAGNTNPKNCYVSENIDFDRVIVADSKEIVGDFLQKEPIITREINFRFAFRYCFKVLQQSITREAYFFWSGVAEELDRSGNIFEVPPGKIRGNIFNKDDISEDVLGYFSAVAIDTIDILITGDDAGLPLQKCAERADITDGSCGNCLSLSKSSIIKPNCFD